MSKKTKYEFCLKDINIKKVEKQFGIVLSSNLNIQNRPENTTKLTDLPANKNTPKIVSFMDESKKKRLCNVTMIDLRSRKNIDGSIYDCFWDNCSIPYGTQPLGCPVRYIPDQIVKSYYSEISKDNYVIKENTTGNCGEDDDRLKIGKRGYYLTDAVFCSFNCCMAFIDYNKHNPLYDYSEMLLLQIYNEIYPGEIPFIEPAQDFRLLIRRGGYLTIEEFRHSFNKIEYVNCGVTNLDMDCEFDDGEVLKQKSLCNLYEEKLKF